MRGYGIVNPNLDIPTPADTVGAAIVTTALAVVSGNWPANAQIGRFSSSNPFMLNMWSTGAAVPTTNSSGSTASTGRSVAVVPGQNGLFQVPGDSTGYSLTAGSSGHITTEFWSKG